MKKILSIKEKKGFTLLFAVIVSTLVLAVGGSIINIALKQVILSGVGRESQYAFYAANTGIECALYWDIAGVGSGNAPAFATSTGFSPAGNAACAGTTNIYDEDDAKWDVTAGSNANVTESYFRLDNFSDVTGPVGYCADVRVFKEMIGNQVASTTIESRGYNTCDSTNPRRIERGLEMNY